MIWLAILYMQLYMQLTIKINIFDKCFYNITHQTRARKSSKAFQVVCSEEAFGKRWYLATIYI